MKYWEIEGTKKKNPTEIRINDVRYRIDSEYVAICQCLMMIAEDLKECMDALNEIKNRRPDPKDLTSEN